MTRLIRIAVGLLLLAGPALAQGVPSPPSDPELELLNLRLQYGTTLADLARAQYKNKLDEQGLKAAGAQRDEALAARDWWIECSKTFACVTWAHSGSPSPQSALSPGNGAKR